MNRGDETYRRLHTGLLLPFLNNKDSETWHHRTVELLDLIGQSDLGLMLLKFLAGNTSQLHDPRLNTDLGGGLNLENPMIVGAGWTKNGQAVRALVEAMNFATVEVGTVTQYPQVGNPKPRQWVSENNLVSLNRRGFDGEGMAAVAKNLAQLYAETGMKVGISLGKNKDCSLQETPQTYAAVADCLYHFAAYMAINVSSPNTPGLRDLQKGSILKDIIQAVKETMDQHGNQLPLFVKVDPDMSLSELDQVIQTTLDARLTGLIAVNTTTSSKIKAEYEWSNQADGLGGANPDYQQLAVARARHIYVTSGGGLKVIGVGGIRDTESALKMVTQGGASAVQVVTGIRTEGLRVATMINRGLLEYMKREGIDQFQNLVGMNIR